MEVSNTTLLYLFLAAVIALGILFAMEGYNYSFAGLGSAKTKTLQKNGDKYVENYFDVINVEDEIREYPDILDYIEKVEEPQLYKNSTIGCYDNNDLINAAKGTLTKTESCKSWYPNVTNINYKPPKSFSATKNNANAKDVFIVDGKPYSFAELCPETSGKDNPVMCQYKRAQAYELLSRKVSNINDTIQDSQNNRLDELDSSTSYHIIDGNRLYNRPSVKDFMGWENSLSMGKNIRGGDAIDMTNDLLLFGKKEKVNYLGSSANII